MSQHQGLSAAGRIKSMKDPNDFPDSSAVSQPASSARTPLILKFCQFLFEIFLHFLQRMCISYTFSSVKSLNNRVRINLQDIRKLFVRKHGVYAHTPRTLRWSKGRSTRYVEIFEISLFLPFSFLQNVNHTSIKKNTDFILFTSITEPVTLNSLIFYTPFFYKSRLTLDILENFSLHFHHEEDIYKAF